MKITYKHFVKFVIPEKEKILKIIGNKNYPKELVHLGDVFPK